MSKRRTKNQKKAAHLHYQLGNWYASAEVQTQNQTTKTARPVPTLNPKITAMTLYGYEPKLIRNDLVKTVIMTMAIMLLEIGLYLARH